MARGCDEALHSAVQNDSCSLFREPNDGHGYADVLHYYLLSSDKPPVICNHMGYQPSLAGFESLDAQVTHLGTLRPSYATKPGEWRNAARNPSAVCQRGKDALIFACFRKLGSLKFLILKHFLRVRVVLMEGRFPFQPLQNDSASKDDGFVPLPHC